MDVPNKNIEETPVSTLSAKVEQFLNQPSGDDLTDEQKANAINFDDLSDEEKNEVAQLLAEQMKKAAASQSTRRYQYLKANRKQLTPKQQKLRKAKRKAAHASRKINQKFAKKR